MTSSNSKLHFSVPPITEAIIAFNFSESIGDRWIEKLPAKLKNEYATKVSLKNYSLNVNISPTGQDTSSVKVDTLGWRLASHDQINLLQITPNFISFHHRAPYTDWEDFVNLAQKGLKELDDLAGITSLRSVATRYLNRIDVPYENLESKSIEFENYFNLFSTIPDEFSAVPSTFVAWSRIFNDTEKNFQYTINFSSTLPVILDHHSFVLDIEVSSMGDIPTKRDELWEFLKQLRDEKNKAFLACLKPKTRELFK